MKYSFASLGKRTVYGFKCAFAPARKERKAKSTNKKNKKRERTNQNCHLFRLLCCLLDFGRSGSYSLILSLPFFLSSCSFIVLVVQFEFSSKQIAKSSKPQEERQYARFALDWVSPHIACLYSFSIMENSVVLDPHLLPTVLERAKSPGLPGPHHKLPFHYPRSPIIFHRHLLCIISGTAE